MLTLISLTQASALPSQKAYLLDQDFDVPFDCLERGSELLDVLARLELVVDAVDVVLDLVAVERVVDVVVRVPGRRRTLAGHIDVATLHRAYQQAEATCEHDVR